ncbi:hypothetical protein HYU22_05350 [Candidatus Woesearchaeota archaeon]|nr:hypothetical protein [Candidatus Woesearchaeota archaeon]
MGKNVLLGIVTISVLLLIIGCTQTPPAAPTPAPAPAAPVVTEEPVAMEEPPVEEPTVTGNSYTIEITSTGFTPKTLVINAGDSITFVNKDTAPHWPASNMHPVHNTYPGSSIDKCGTSEENTIFDSCRGLEQGEEFTFTFNAAGTWPFHDHLRVSRIGVITVKR